MAARAVRRRQTIFIGDKIRHMRKERQLSQSDLARKIGVQQSDLCRMENGEYRVSLDALFKILGVFGMDIGEFFRDPDAPMSASDRERELVKNFSRLDDASQQEILEFVRFRARGLD